MQRRDDQCRLLPHSVDEIEMFVILDWHVICLIHINWRRYSTSNIHTVGSLKWSIRQGGVDRVDLVKAEAMICDKVG